MKMKTKYTQKCIINRRSNLETQIITFVSVVQVNFVIKKTLKKIREQTMHTNCFKLFKIKFVGKLEDLYISGIRLEVYWMKLFQVS